MSKQPAKIRFFEFPQVFISLPPFVKSLDFLNRRLKYLEIPLTIYSIPDIPKPETVKIEQSMYVTGINATLGHATVLDVMKKSKVIRPCKLHTILRLLLAEDVDNKSLPRFISDADFCIAFLTSGEMLRINLIDKTAKLIDKEKMTSISKDTPLILETDPL